MRVVTAAFVLAGALVCGGAQYQGAYTSTNPTHIVLASADISYGGFGSTEMLFHESSHALIMKVVTAVNAALARSNKPRFRLPIEQHVQPYLDGKITLEQMAENLAEAIP